MGLMALMREVVANRTSFHGELLLQPLVLRELKGGKPMVEPLEWLPREVALVEWLWKP